PTQHDEAEALWALTLDRGHRLHDSLVLPVRAPHLYSPQRILLNISSTCWSGARFKVRDAFLYKVGRSSALPYSTSSDCSITCLQTLSRRDLAMVMAPSGSECLRSKAFVHAV